MPNANLIFLACLLLLLVAGAYSQSCSLMNPNKDLLDSGFVSFNNQGGPNAQHMLIVQVSIPTTVSQLQGVACTFPPT
jgi:hypothetical protein